MIVCVYVCGVRVCSSVGVGDGGLVGGGCLLHLFLLYNNVCRCVYIVYVYRDVVYVFIHRGLRVRVGLCVCANAVCVAAFTPARFLPCHHSTHAPRTTHTLQLRPRRAMRHTHNTHTRTNH